MRFSKVLIVGYGNIGVHLYDELNVPGVDLYVYDPYKQVDIPRFTNNLDYFIDTKFDLAFICVPTEMRNDGSCDISQVIDAVEKVSIAGNTEIIVIKSTIPVGTCDELSKKFSNIVFSPEYYGTTIHAPKKLDFVVLGGEKELCTEVANFYYTIKSGSLRIKFTDYRTAELAKYMENCFLATKVAFCSEFAIIAEEFGINYPELREIFVMDERMGESHTLIRPEQPYFDSHCLNKDIPGLIKQSGESKLMNAVNEINKERKTRYGKGYRNPETT